MEIYDRQFMELAIDAARKCQGDPKHPLVGAVAALDGKYLGVAHRSEFTEGEHAEYTLLERHLRRVPLSGATIYTTLEPCTHRIHQAHEPEILKAYIRLNVFGPEEGSPIPLPVSSKRGHLYLGQRGHYYLGLTHTNFT